MIELLKNTYFSKSDTYLLPLTGLSKRDMINSYLFWGAYSIENCELILKIDWEDYDEFLNYCQEQIFPKLGSTLLMTHDNKGSTVFVVDISEWAEDLDHFLKGKYSNLSQEAKTKITHFHIIGNTALCPPHIYYSLHPKTKFAPLGNKTPIEYVADNYGMDLDVMTEIGEIGSLFNPEEETLLTKMESLS